MEVTERAISAHLKNPPPTGAPKLIWKQYNTNLQRLKQLQKEIQEVITWLDQGQPDKPAVT
jgi:hypothetical protein